MTARWELDLKVRTAGCLMSVSWFIDWGVGVGGGEAERIRMFDWAVSSREYFNTTKRIYYFSLQLHFPRQFEMKFAVTIWNDSRTMSSSLDRGTYVCFENDLVVQGCRWGSVYSSLQMPFWWDVRLHVWTAHIKLFHKNCPSYIKCDASSN